MNIPSLCQHKGCFERDIRRYDTQHPDGSYESTWRCATHARADGYLAPDISEWQREIERRLAVLERTSKDDGK